MQTKNDIKFPWYGLLIALPAFIILAPIVAIIIALEQSVLKKPNENTKILLLTIILISLIAGAIAFSVNGYKKEQRRTYETWVINNGAYSVSFEDWVNVFYGRKK